MSVRLPPVVIVGHPLHRRVTGFARALQSAGFDTPRVLAHAELLAEPDRLLSLPHEPLWIRIESLGQDDAVAHGLLRAGRDQAIAEGRCRVVSEAELRSDPPRGFELRAPRQAHFGVLSYLETLSAIAAERPRWRFFTHPRDIASMFDKDETAARLARAGIPVPHALSGAPCASVLTACMDASGAPRAFVKLLHGSSAVGLAYVKRAPTACGLTLWTTLARRGERFFNSRRICRYDRPHDVDAVLTFLHREGARTERALPKARVGARFADLRVLVVAGDPVCVVVRTSTHVITNLHLGGRPDDPDVFRSSVPPEAWQRAMTDASRAAEIFTAFHAGIDLLFDPSRSMHTVLEVNAFGDLLNGVRIAGLAPYDYQAQLLRKLAHSNRYEAARSSESASWSRPMAR